MDPIDRKPQFFGKKARKARQHSSGGILFKKRGNHIRVCLLSKKGGKVWAIPKGRVNEGETLEQTAERELLEETGHRGKVEHLIDAIDYYFFLKENNTFYHKTVSFYLISLIEENAQERDEEADEVRWFDIGQAKSRLSYLNEKKILEKAQSLLKYY